jgi:hypothetical protein
MTPAERLILQSLSVLLQGQIQHDPLDGAPQVVLDQIEAMLDSQTTDEVDALKIYHRIPIYKAYQALKDGWIPVPPNAWTHCDGELHVWMTWIECACGRAMPVPR